MAVADLVLVILSLRHKYTFLFLLISSTTMSSRPPCPKLTTFGTPLIFIMFFNLLRYLYQFNFFKRIVPSILRKSSFIKKNHVLEIYNFKLNLSQEQHKI